MIAQKRVLYQTILQLIFTLPWAIAFGDALDMTQAESDTCTGKLPGWAKFTFVISTIHAAWTVITAILFYFGFETYYTKTEKPCYLKVLQIFQYLLAVGSVFAFFGVLVGLTYEFSCPPLENVSRVYVVVNFVLFMLAYIGYMMVTTCFKDKRKYYDWSIEEKERLNLDLVK